MIAYLSGIIQQISDDGLVLDVGGVGYDVKVCRSVLDSQIETGKPLNLVVHTEVKEDEISLWGFRDPAEKKVFLLLQKVKGIGSRLSMGIVSVLGVQRTCGLIAAGDAASLQTVPGVGKKTAERVVLELKDALGQLASGFEPLSVHKPTQVNLSRSEEDVVLALEKLGFSNDRARNALANAMTKGIDPTDTSQLLRTALSNL